MRIFGKWLIVLVFVLSLTTTGVFAVDTLDDDSSINEFVSPVDPDPDEGSE